MVTTDVAPPGRRSADAWLVAVGASAVTWFITAAAPTSLDGDPTVPVITQVLLALAVGTGAFVIVRRFPPAATGGLIALVTGLFLCGGATALLNSTPFGPLGAALDQGYRTAYLTKFGHTWQLVDYAYKGLPSFYPPLYFWVLGHLGTVLGVASWQMLKIGMLAVAFVVPTGGWLLWRPVVGPRRAAVVIVATSLVFHDWYVPHLWLAIAIFVPWWLHFVMGVGRDPGARLGRGQLALGIALGAVVALTYWYVVLIGLVHLAGVAATRVGRRERSAQPPDLRNAAIVLGGVVVVTVPYWLPLVVNVLTTSGAQTMQNRYYTADQVSLPFPFLTFDTRGAVLAFGLAALVVTAHRRRVARHLLGLVGAAYLLYLAGYLGFLAHYPLDTLRTTGLIEFALAAGTGLGAADLWRIATTHDVDLGSRVPWSYDRQAAAALVAVVAVVFVFALGQTAVRAMPFLTEQRAAKYPSALIDGFTRATAGDYEDAVVLTDNTDLSSFLPTYVFNVANAHYSHPSAHFEDRAELLTQLSREADADVFALALLHNRYDEIDYVALRRGTDGLPYSWLDDAFPRGAVPRSIRFSADSFATDAFATLPSAGTGLELYRVRRASDPLRSLRRCPANPRRTQCARLGVLLDRYSRHLDDDARDLAQRWRAAR